MKKLSFLFAVLLLTALLAGCGQNNAQPQTTADAAPQETQGTKLTSSLPGAVDPKDPKQIARSLVDHELSELIEAIGEPISADYASSCLGPGQDGALQYEGFTVYTYREGDHEIVREVEG